MIFPKASSTVTASKKQTYSSVSIPKKKKQNDHDFLFSLQNFYFCYALFWKTLLERKAWLRLEFCSKLWGCKVVDNWCFVWLLLRFCQRRREVVCAWTWKRRSGLCKRDSSCFSLFLFIFLLLPSLFCVSILLCLFT